MILCTHGSVDRLPTISASQALQNAATRSKAIPSSLSKLDEALRPPTRANTESTGIPRGQVTEIYGPPGVGKTALAMQLAANALRSGSGVVWIDTGAPLPGPRFEMILNTYMKAAGQDLVSSSGPMEGSTHELLKRLTYFNVPTLAHLLALFLHPTEKMPAAGTALVVLDNVTAPFATAFPPTHENKRSNVDKAHRIKVQWAANRKWAVAGDLATAMSKMAAIHDLAILAINQVATSLKGVRKAVLRPAITGTAWEPAMHNRVIMWQDFAQGECGLDLSQAGSVRFAQVLKAGGRTKSFNPEDAVAYVIEEARPFREV
jgi:RecA/RadA recombinase